MLSRNTDSDRPRFSIVSAVYNVAKYLPDFIDSIEAQSFDLDDVEVIMVDDGSTDNSPAILDDWFERRPHVVKVLRKPNGGQASARNLGIDHARGEWVTFIDPDDFVNRGYLSAINKFIDRNPSAMMVAARRRIHFDRTGKRTNHPLHIHFSDQNQLRNLNYDSAYFHGHAPCAFFRLDEIRRQGRYFDDRIRPTFEDVHFCSWYLLDAPAPIIGYVRTAQYIYRKRADASSTLDASWTHPGRWDTVPEIGYLPLLREAARRHGQVPLWLQTMFLYELSWYFRIADAVPEVETAAHGEIARRFNSHLAEVTTFLDPQFVLAYAARRLTNTHRDILMHSFRPEPWRSDIVVLDRLDGRQRLMRARIRFTGDHPSVQFFVNGVAVEPVHRKIRDLVYFERVALHELVAWIPAGTVRVVVDGTEVDLSLAEPEPRTHVIEEKVIRDQLTLNKTAELAQSVPRGWRNRLIVRAARSRVANKIFRRAWVLQDRIYNADDSAEHLFTYLRSEHEEVNAWFVLSKDSADWARLRQHRSRRRVVAHGSLRWKLLMLNCQHLISSHADLRVMTPPELRPLTDQPRWRKVFLQHGVTKDDLSNWLNIKDFDLFVTSTPAEFRSVTGDHTSYTYTSREVVMSGLPRFDLVRAAGQKYPPDKRDLILIAPTWRRWLAADEDQADGQKRVELDSFRESDFAHNWLAVLRSAELKELADRHGLRIAVLPHPVLQRVMSVFDLPDYIERFSFHVGDVRDVFARARVFATDYSSMFFNAAYIDRPIVYFQFDRDRVLSGGHLGRAGYFDYERDGFGPVAPDAGTALAAIAEAVTAGPHPQPMYQRRIDEAFPVRDGRCRERVFEAIRDSTRPQAPRRLRLQAEGDVVDGVVTPLVEVSDSVLNGDFGGSGDAGSSRTQSSLAETETEIEDEARAFDAR